MSGLRPLPGSLFSPSSGSLTSPRKTLVLVRDLNVTVPPSPATPMAVSRQSNTSTPVSTPVVVPTAQISQLSPLVSPSSQCVVSHRVLPFSVEDNRSLNEVRQAIMEKLSLPSMSNRLVASLSRSLSRSRSKTTRFFFSQLSFELDGANVELHDDQDWKLCCETAVNASHRRVILLVHPPHSPDPLVPESQPASQPQPPQEQQQEALPQGAQQLQAASSLPNATAAAAELHVVATPADFTGAAASATMDVDVASTASPSTISSTTPAHN